MTGISTWSPSSWRDRPIEQQPEWPDQAALTAVLDQLCAYPPLVFAGEARKLTAALARVHEGKAFLLQAGDCAESFNGFTADSIRDKLKVILQMAVVLTYAGGLPVVKVGRIAGQFGKPRSAPTEERDGTSLPIFRGYIVNDPAFDVISRVADPRRLLTAYHQSASTLNLLRAFATGGFADLSRMHTWNQEFVATSREGRRYEALAQEIERAMRFMASCGIDLEAEPALHQVDFYTSHEALILPYEEALTRVDSLSGDWYDCSAHLVWVGERTRQVDGAHVEFASGIHNPVGVKLGPTAEAGDALALCQRLNPQRQPGRLTIISRMGSGQVRDRLGPIVEAVTAAGHPVVWACDPMHGNTFASPSGHKTRHFDDVIDELRGYFEVHADLGTWPGGIHVELTGDDVTECLGGAEEVLAEHLDTRYETACDPRLNARQSLDLAFRVAEMIRF